MCKACGRSFRRGRVELCRLSVRPRVADQVRGGGQSGSVRLFPLRRYMISARARLRQGGGKPSQLCAAGQSERARLRKVAAGAANQANFAGRATGGDWESKRKPQCMESIHRVATQMWGQPPMREARRSAKGWMSARIRWRSRQDVEQGLENVPSLWLKSETCTYRHSPPGKRRRMHMRAAPVVRTPRVSIP